MLELAIEIAGFIATGAAWGIFWLAVLSLIVKSWCNASLLQVLIYIFIVTAGITAFFIFRDLYHIYSDKDSPMRDWMLLSYRMGNRGMLFFTLAVIASPVLFLFKPVKSSNILVAVIVASYILLPYYDRMFEFIRESFL